MHAVTYFDGMALRDGTLTSDSSELRVRAGSAPPHAPRLDGVVSGLFTDHHVHLQLVDPSGLAPSRLGRVIDLGGNPDVLRTALHNSGDFPPIADEAALSATEAAVSPELCRLQALRASVEIEFAGAFVTTVGGYPSDREWAPEGSVREIADADAAERTVREMKDAGANWIKVVANSDAGPVLTDDLFRAVIAAAAVHRLRVVAHAEGAGQAQRVVRLGASRLAHAPFSERLTDSEIAAQAASVSWVSTLAIHDGPAYEHAVDNVRRFAAAGGELRYGSDMGNGPTPPDLRDAEITALREAGIDGLDLLLALAPLDPLAPEAELLLLPDGDPALSRRLTHADLKV